MLIRKVGKIFYKKDEQLLEEKIANEE